MTDRPGSLDRRDMADAGSAMVREFVETPIREAVSQFAGSQIQNFPQFRKVLDSIPPAGFRLGASAIAGAIKGQTQNPVLRLFYDTLEGGLVGVGRGLSDVDFKKAVISRVDEMGQMHGALLTGATDDDPMEFATRTEVHTVEDDEDGNPQVTCGRMLEDMSLWQQAHPGRAGANNKPAVPGIPFPGVFGPRSKVRNGRRTLCPDCTGTPAAIAGETRVATGPKSVFAQLDDHEKAVLVVVMRLVREQGRFSDKRVFESLRTADLGLLKEALGTGIKQRRAAGTAPRIVVNNEVIGNVLGVVDYAGGGDDTLVSRAKDRLADMANRHLDGEVSSTKIVQVGVGTATIFGLLWLALAGFGFYQFFVVGWTGGTDPFAVLVGGIALFLAVAALLPVTDLFGSVAATLRAAGASVFPGFATDNEDEGWYRPFAIGTMVFVLVFGALVILSIILAFPPISRVFLAVAGALVAAAAIAAKRANLPLMWRNLTKRNLSLMVALTAVFLIAAFLGGPSLFANRVLLRAHDPGWANQVGAVYQIGQGTLIEAGRHEFTAKQVFGEVPVKYGRVWADQNGIVHALPGVEAVLPGFLARARPEANGSVRFEVKESRWGKSLSVAQSTADKAIGGAASLSLSGVTGGNASSNPSTKGAPVSADLWSFLTSGPGGAVFRFCLIVGLLGLGAFFLLGWRAIPENGAWGPIIRVVLMLGAILALIVVLLGAGSGMVRGAKSFVHGSSSSSAPAKVVAAKKVPAKAPAAKPAVVSGGATTVSTGHTHNPDVDMCKHLTRPESRAAYGCPK